MEVLTSMLALLFCLVSLGGIMYLMRERNSAHVRMMWFAFSLMYVSSVAFLIYAASKNWIGIDGAIASGTAGEWIRTGMKFMLDLDGTAMLIVSVLGGFILIHLIVYVPTGIFGCASDFSFISNAIDISTIFFLKGFASASALLLAILSCNSYYNWYNVNSSQATASIGFATGLFALGFAILYMQTEKPALVKWLKPKTPKVLHRLHEKATRHSRNEEDLVNKIGNAAMVFPQISSQNSCEYVQFRKDMLELIGLLKTTQEDEASISAEIQQIAKGQPSPEDVLLQRKARIEELHKKWDIDEASSSTPNTEEQLS